MNQKIMHCFMILITVFQNYQFVSTAALNPEDGQTTVQGEQQSVLSNILEHQAQLQLHLGQLQQQITAMQSQSVTSSQGSRSGPVDRQSANISQLLNHLFDNYDKRLRPNYKGPAVQVGVTMFISSISSISEPNMDFTVEVYFRQYWKDERLAFNDTDELCISNEMLEKMWWPDTFFATAKKADFHHTTTKNIFLRIAPSGDILLSLRLTITSTCLMDFTYFPMDSQVCNVEIESYGFSVKDINYRWHKGLKDSFGIEKDIQLPTFRLRSYKLEEALQVLSTGNYTRLKCRISFSRNLGHYIIFIYIPSSLLVVISWVSFWLHVDSAPARIALGITCVLTMTTLITGTNAALPKISYLKSVDVFLVSCYFAVFATLMEYAVVNYLVNRLKARQALEQALASSAACVCSSTLSIDMQPRFKNVHVQNRRSMQSADSDVTNNKNGVSRPPGARDTSNSSSPRLWPQSLYRRPVIIDEYSRKIFPIIFVCYNCAYWLIYLNISQAAQDEDGYHKID